MPEPATLAEAFERYGPYPADHPSTLRTLVDADPDTLSHPLAWFLRKQALEAQRSADKHRINTPKDAARLLRNGWVLHPWTDHWVSYGLSSERTVITVAHPRGTVASLRKATKLAPTVDDLPALPPGDPKSPKAPAWLVVFGGTPDVLAKPGVAKRLAHLRRELPVVDVLFWSFDRQTSSPPVLWSVTAGSGMEITGSPGGRTVPFPDPEALAAVRSYR